MLFITIADVWCVLQENELNKKKPLYIKAKERTAHMVKKVEVEKKSLNSAKKAHDTHQKEVSGMSVEVL